MDMFAHLPLHEIKFNLEKFIYYLNNPSIHPTKKRKFFSEVIESLAVCGPGIHTDTGDLRARLETEIENVISIPDWLADLQGQFVQEYASQHCLTHHIIEIDNKGHLVERVPGYPKHVRIAFAQTAIESGWFSKGAAEYKDKYLNDRMLARLHISEESKQGFRNFFQARYNPVRILERIAYDFSLQLNKLLEAKRMTVANWIDTSQLDSFIKNVKLLLNKMGLDIATDFFDINEDNPYLLRYNPEKFKSKLITFFTPYPLAVEEALTRFKEKLRDIRLKALEKYITEFYERSQEFEIDAEKARELLRFLSIPGEFKSFFVPKADATLQIDFDKLKAAYIERYIDDDNWSEWLGPFKDEESLATWSVLKSAESKAMTDSIYFAEIQQVANSMGLDIHKIFDFNRDENRLQLNEKKFEAEFENLCRAEHRHLFNSEAWESWGLPSIELQSIALTPPNAASIRRPGTLYLHQSANGLHYQFAGQFEGSEVKFQGVIAWNKLPRNFPELKSIITDESEHKSLATIIEQIHLQEPFLRNHPLNKLVVHHAAEKGDFETVNLLLTHCLVPQEELRDGLGRTPLHYAVLKKHPEIANIILEFYERGHSGACFKADVFGKTPLHYALESKQGDLARKLLEQQKLAYDPTSNQPFIDNVDLRDEHGKTLIEYAIEYGYVYIATEIFMQPNHSFSQRTLQKLLNAYCKEPGWMPNNTILMDLAIKIGGEDWKHLIEQSADGTQIRFKPLLFKAYFLQFCQANNKFSQPYQLRTERFRELKEVAFVYVDNDLDRAWFQGPHGKALTWETLPANIDKVYLLGSLITALLPPEPELKIDARLSLESKNAKTQEIEKKYQELVSKISGNFNNIIKNTKDLKKLFSLVNDTRCKAILLNQLENPQKFIQNAANLAWLLKHLSPQLISKQILNPEFVQRIITKVEDALLLINLLPHRSTQEIAEVFKLSQFDFLTPLIKRGELNLIRKLFESWPTMLTDCPYLQNNPSILKETYSLLHNAIAADNLFLQEAILNNPVLLNQLDNKHLAQCLLLAAQKENWKYIEFFLDKPDLISKFDKKDLIPVFFKLIHRNDKLANRFGMLLREEDVLTLAVTQDDEKAIDYFVRDEKLLANVKPADLIKNCATLIKNNKPQLARVLFDRIKTHAEVPAFRELLFQGLSSPKPFWVDFVGQLATGFSGIPKESEKELFEELTQKHNLLLLDYLIPSVGFLTVFDPAALGTILANLIKSEEWDLATKLNRYSYSIQKSDPLFTEIAFQLAEEEKPDPRLMDLVIHNNKYLGVEKNGETCLVKAMRLNHWTLIEYLIDKRDLQYVPTPQLESLLSKLLDANHFSLAEKIFRNIRYSSIYFSAEFLSKLLHLIQSNRMSASFIEVVAGLSYVNNKPLGGEIIFAMIQQQQYQSAQAAINKNTPILLPLFGSWHGYYPPNPPVEYAFERMPVNVETGHTVLHDLASDPNSPFDLFERIANTFPDKLNEKSKNGEDCFEVALRNQHRTIIEFLAKKFSRNFISPIRYYLQNPALLAQLPEPLLQQVLFPLLKSKQIALACELLDKRKSLSIDTELLAETKLDVDSTLQIIQHATVVTEDVIYKLISMKQPDLATTLLQKNPSLIRRSIDRFYLHNLHALARMVLEMKNPTQEILTYLFGSVPNYASLGVGMGVPLLCAAAQQGNTTLVNLIIEDKNVVWNNFSFSKEQISMVISSLFQKQQYNSVISLLKKCPSNLLSCPPFLQSAMTENKDSKENGVITTILQQLSATEMVETLKTALKYKHFLFIKMVMDNRLITKLDDRDANFIFESLVHLAQFELANQFRLQFNIKPNREIFNTVLSYPNQLNLELIKFCSVEGRFSYMHDEQKDGSTRLSRAISKDFLSLHQVELILSTPDFLDLYSKRQLADIFLKMVANRQYYWANQLLNTKPDILNWVEGNCNPLLSQLLDFKDPSVSQDQHELQRILLLKICECTINTTIKYIDFGFLSRSLCSNNNFDALQKLIAKDFSGLRNELEREAVSNANAESHQLFFNRIMEAEIKPLKSLYPALLEKKGTPPSLLVNLFIKLIPFWQLPKITSGSGNKQKIYIQKSQKEDFMNEVNTLISKLQSPEEIVRLIDGLFAMRDRIPWFLPTGILQKGTPWKEGIRVSNSWLSMVDFAQKQILALAKSHILPRHENLAKIREFFALKAGKQDSLKEYDLLIQAKLGVHKVGFFAGAGAGAEPINQTPSAGPGPIDHKLFANPSGTPHVQGKDVNQHEKTKKESKGCQGPGAGAGAGA